MEDEMETASQRVSESASQLAPAVIEATAEEDVLADLKRRVRELETAVGEVRSVRASAAGRKTTVAVAASGSGSVDAALQSLSVEQRIAVKSGLMRAGLL